MSNEKNIRKEQIEQATSISKPYKLASRDYHPENLVIEVHIHPDQARSDGSQSLSPEQFAEMMPKFRAIASVLDRKL